MKTEQESKLTSLESTPESTIKELSKYFGSKNYKMIDVTTLLNTETHNTFMSLLTSDSDIILYLKKNEDNENIFSIYCIGEHNDYLFFNKNNFISVNIPCTSNPSSLGLSSVPDTFNVNLKRCIERFLEHGEEISECMICFNGIKKLHSCNICFCLICNECFQKILNQTNNVKCPKCRADI